MKKFLLVTVLMLVSAAALGQVTVPATPIVVVPWGDWLAGVLVYLKEIVISAFVLVFGILLRSVPAQMASFLQAANIEQLVGRAVDYGIAATAGAVKGKTVDFNVSNEILRNAVQYVVSSAPDLAEKYADTLRAKVLARMGAAGVVAPEATAAALNATVPPAPVPVAALP